MHETTSNISPPVLIYIGMGLITARILLAKIDLRRLTRLEWLQFLVKAGSIVLLWPLVLFLEKFETWLKLPE
jgi:cell division protein FtsW (lipid II flippase)